jgi:hypothetical protein
MQKVKKIGVLSLAKIFGIIYAFFGFIGGILFTVLSLFGFNSDQLGYNFGIGGLLLLPIIYGVFGFIGGLLSAYVYNLAAARLGGIVVEITK